MNITDFLLARIEEDEADAQTDAEEMAKSSVSIQFDCATQARFTPARALAECAAKRAIIEQRNRSDKSMSMDDWSMGWADGNYAALYALAAVYKDHPDYQQEWAVE